MEMESGVELYGCGFSLHGFFLVSLASFPDRASLGELNENDALRLKTESSNTLVPQCSVHHKASLRDSGQLLRGATAL